MPHATDAPLGKLSAVCQEAAVGLSPLSSKGGRRANTNIDDAATPTRVSRLRFQTGDRQQAQRVADPVMDASQRCREFLGSAHRTSR
jgi:hypothetical protein